MSDDWKLDGVCRTAVASGAVTEAEMLDVFFPSGKGQNLLHPARWMCARCPVLSQCGEAMVYEMAGFVGGMSEEDRRHVRMGRMSVAGLHADLVERFGPDVGEETAA